MGASFRGGLLSGVIFGGAVTALAFLLARPRPAPVPPPADPKPSEAVQQLREENERLQRKVIELAALKAEPAPAGKKKEEPTPVETPVKPEIRELFGKLAEAGLAGMRGPKFGEALEAVKAAGKPAVDYLKSVLRSSTSATERFMAAALLEGAGDAAAVDALADVLKGDKDDMVRRMASHAIAVLGSPAAEAPLRAATTGDSDWGVRVNSAYGLAKLGMEDGLRILKASYESPETPGEYRLPILGGLADVAAPSTAPLFRSILADTKDVSYILVSIGALEKMKDAESIPALQQIAGSTQPEMVKQAALKAIETIRK